VDGVTLSVIKITGCPNPIPDVISIIRLLWERLGMPPSKALQFLEGSVVWRLAGLDGVPLSAFAVYCLENELHRSGFSFQVRLLVSATWHERLLQEDLYAG